MSSQLDAVMPDWENELLAGESQALRTHVFQRPGEAAAAVIVAVSHTDSTLVAGGPGRPLGTVARGGQIQRWTRPAVPGDGRVESVTPEGLALWAVGADRAAAGRCVVSAIRTELQDISPQRDTHPHPGLPCLTGLLHGLWFPVQRGPISSHSHILRAQES